MSTILDALRKVERERDPSSEAALDAPTVSSEPRRRRSFPIGAVVACALVGFGGGAILSWWLPGSDSGVEVASLPEPPPPPDIAVPRPPLQAKPAAAAAPVEDDVGRMQPPGAPPAVPLPAAPPVAAPPAAEPPAAQARSPIDGPAVALDKVPAPPAALPPKATIPEGSPALAAIDPKASALEPSPFKPSREPVLGAATEPAKKPVAEAPRAPERREPQDLAALAPAPAVEPDVPTAEEAAMDPDPEPEPESSPETLVDTGRSPPGAPKVALSFLQWSTDPARRFAFISIDGAPTQRVREGEVAAGMTIAAITPNGVQFRREGTVFVIRPRH